MMECLDFAAIADIDTSDAGAVCAFVKQELERMLANGQLPGEWYALVIPEMIEAFVESPIAPADGSSSCAWGSVPGETVCDAASDGGSGGRCWYRES